MRQKSSLAKFCWDMASLLVAIAVIGNVLKPDIPAIRSVIAILVAFIFAILGLYIDGKSED